jgi:lysophospholipase L1-like esterase
MHKPWHSLFFGLMLFSTLALLGFIFPPDGVKLSDAVKLNFPRVKELFFPEAAKTDITKLLEAVDQIDTNFTIVEPVLPLENDSVVSLADTIDEIKEYEKKDTVKRLITGIQYKNISALKNFFEALRRLKTNPQLLRVLHYGDSQIEGDRITDYIRLKLQGQFGGQGPGLISLMPISQSVINKITNGPGWDRYNVFTMKDKRVRHSNYGILGGFCRFHEYRKLKDTSSVVSSNIVITTTKAGGENALEYKRIKLFYGGSQTKTWCELYDGPALIAADSLEAGGFFKVKEYKTGLGSNTHKFKFRGKDSPDFYGLSLESETGVMVDNIALRGSSGTFFHQINAMQLEEFYDYLNVRLIILQFGGNALPAIENYSMAVNYANYLRGQIAILKRTAPDASILFIGPSDMSIKSGTKYVTYPYLEIMRNEIKRVVLESGCAFFDMYDCMGGKNSMASWVEKKLAAPDYTHFSPQGARKMATIFYSELINEYNNYLKTAK